MDNNTTPTPEPIEETAFSNGINIVNKDLYKKVNDDSKGFFNFQNNEDLVESLMTNPYQRASFLWLYGYIDREKYPKITRDKVKEDGTVDYGSDETAQHYNEQYKDAAKQWGLPFDETIKGHKSPTNPNKGLGFVDYADTDNDEEETETQWDSWRTDTSKFGKPTNYVEEREEQEDTFGWNENYQPETKDKVVRHNTIRLDDTSVPREWLNASDAEKEEATKLYNELTGGYSVAEVAAAEKKRNAALVNIDEKYKDKVDDEDAMLAWAQERQAVDEKYSSILDTRRTYFLQQVEHTQKYYENRGLSYPMSNSGLELTTALQLKRKRESDKAMLENAKALTKDISAALRQAEATAAIAGRSAWNINPTSTPEADEARMLQAAVSLMSQTEGILKAPYVEDNNLLSMFKGIANGAADIDTWTFGLLGLRDSSQIDKIAHKLNDGEELTEPEQMLMAACISKVEAEMLRNEDIANLYTNGQTGGASLGFMAQFLLMRNPTNLAMKGLTTGGKFLAKFAASNAGKLFTKFASKYGSKWFGKAASKAGTKLTDIATRLATPTAEATEAAATQAAQPTVKGEIGKALTNIGRDLSESAVQAVITPANIIAAKTAENWDIGLDPSGNPIAIAPEVFAEEKAVLDNIIEWFSEGTGTIADNAGNLLFRTLGNRIAKRLHLTRLTKSKFHRILNPYSGKFWKAAGVSSIAGEMTEEMWGAGLRKAFDIMDEAEWDAFWSPEGFRDMFIGFASTMIPMGIFSGAVSYTKASRVRSRARENFRRELSSVGFSDAEIDGYIEGFKQVDIDEWFDTIDNVCRQNNIEGDNKKEVVAAFMQLGMADLAAEEILNSEEDNDATRQKIRQGTLEAFGEDIEAAGLTFDDIRDISEQSGIDEIAFGLAINRQRAGRETAQSATAMRILNSYKAGLTAEREYLERAKNFKLINGGIHLVVQYTDKETGEVKVGEVERIPELSDNVTSVKELGDQNVMHVQIDGKLYDVNDVQVVELTDDINQEAKRRGKIASRKQRVIDVFTKGSIATINLDGTKATVEIVDVNEEKGLFTIRDSEGTIQPQRVSWQLLETWAISEKAKRPAYNASGNLSDSLSFSVGGHGTGKNVNSYIVTFTERTGKRKRKIREQTKRLTEDEVFALMLLSNENGRVIDTLPPERKKDVEEIAKRFREDLGLGTQQNNNGQQQNNNGQQQRQQQSNNAPQDHNQDNQTSEETETEEEEIEDTETDEEEADDSKVSELLTTLLSAANDDLRVAYQAITAQIEKITAEINKYNNEKQQQKNKILEDIENAPKVEATIADLDAKISKLQQKADTLLQVRGKLVKQAEQLGISESSLQGQPAQSEQEAKATAEQEAKEKAEQEAKAKAEQEAKEKAEQEAKAKAEQEAKEKAEQEAKAKAEQEAKEKAEQEAKANAEQKQDSNQNRLVSDERYEELKKRMRDKLRNQLNMGIDPEVLAIGIEMAVYHIERGARKFIQYAKAMIDDLGGASKPYLKAFYNGARDMPQITENGLNKEMTSYDEVAAFDINSLKEDTSNSNQTKDETAASEEQGAKEEARQETKEKAEQEAKAEAEQGHKAEEQDSRDNPLNADGSLKVETVSSIDEITDEDNSGGLRENGETDSTSTPKETPPQTSSTDKDTAKTPEEAPTKKGEQKDNTTNTATTAVENVTAEVKQKQEAAKNAPKEGSPAQKYLALSERLKAAKRKAKVYSMGAREAVKEIENELRELHKFVRDNDYDGKLSLSELLQYIQVSARGNDITQKQTINEIYDAAPDPFVQGETKHKFDVSSYTAGKNETRKVLQGVLYKDGYVTACDGHIIVQKKEDYPAEKEGKIFNDKGYEIDSEGGYPKVGGVFPTSTDNLTMSYFDAADMERWCSAVVEQSAKARALLEVGERKAATAYVLIKIGSTYVAYNADLLYKFTQAAAEIGATKLYFEGTENCPLYAESDKGRVKLMPIRFESQKMPTLGVYAYRGTTSDIADMSLDELDHYSKTLEPRIEAAKENLKEWREKQKDDYGLKRAVASGKIPNTPWIIYNGLKGERVDIETRRKELSADNQTEQKDAQGNPLNADGSLKVEAVSSVDEITDEDNSGGLRENGETDSTSTPKETPPQTSSTDKDTNKTHEETPTKKGEQKDDTTNTATTDIESIKTEVKQKQGEQAHKEGYIDDYGEKIEGARKDMLRDMSKQCNDATKAQFVALPFSKAFPKPNLAKLVETGVLREKDAAVVWAMYKVMENGNKPKKTFALDNWAREAAKMAKMMKEFVEADANGRDKMVEQIKAIYPKIKTNEYSHAIGLGKQEHLTILPILMPALEKYSVDELEQINKIPGPTTRYYLNEEGQYVCATSHGRSQADLIADFRSQIEIANGLDHEFTKDELSVWSDVSGGYVISFLDRLTGHRLYFEKHPTYDAAVFAINNDTDTLSEKANEANKRRFKKESKSNDNAKKEIKLYTARFTDTNGKDHYVIMPYDLPKNVDKILRLSGIDIFSPIFDSRPEAYTYMITCKGEIQQHVAEVIQEIKDASSSFKEGTGRALPRVGKDWRSGKNVTAKDFVETFGFRGVQFGNWTDQEDRQGAINQTYDAFMDLAEIIGVSPKALSLNGELGIAFGARGSGKAAAHYEPTQVVINLTKTRGAGALAHEWWHAIDNYLSRGAGVSAGFATDIQAQNKKLRNEVSSAIQDLMKKVNESAYYARSASRGAYWSKPTELGARLFASWVAKKMRDSNLVNTFLTDFDEEDFAERVHNAAYRLYEKQANRLGNKVQSPEEWKKEHPQAMLNYPYAVGDELTSLGAAMQKLFDTLDENTDEQTGKTALFRKEQGETTTAANADSVKAAASDLQRQFGVEVEVIDSPDNIPNATARKAIAAGQNVKGWYDIKTGKVYLYAPNIESKQDAATTYIHEVVAHSGMRQLLGEDKYNELCEKLYNQLTDEQKERISQYSDQSAEVQGDEYFAAIAETMIDEKGNIKEPSLFRKFVATIRNFFRDILGISLSDNDIRYMLWKSANNLKRNSNKATQLNDAITEMRFSMESENTAEEERTIRDAKANGTYLNAPNGKDTNLTPKQWVRVRTKAFKRWFGDWELLSRTVNIVKCTKEHGFKNFAEARAWAKSSEGIARLYTDKETGGKGNINISKGAVDKFLQQNAVEKSENKDIHLAVLRALPDVLRESVDAEQHPDYKKGADGVRRPENGINPNVTIHRLYGAVNIDGKTYRVKITVKEDSTSNSPIKAHSYEATEIELQAGTLGNSETDLSPDTNNSISAAKLLEDVEKSYSNGERLLDGISKVVDENGEPRVLYHGTSEFGFSVFDSEYSDDKVSLFFTSDVDVARSYAGINAKIRNIGDEGAFLDERAILDAFFEEQDLSSGNPYDVYTSLFYASKDLDISVEWNDDDDSLELESFVTGSRLEMDDNTYDYDTLYNWLLENAAIENMGEENAGIYAVFLNAKKVLTIDACGGFWWFIPTKLIEGYDESCKNVDTREIAAFAASKGYDAVHITELLDAGSNGYGVVGDRPSDIWISLNGGSAIKSATENNGDYSSNNNDIRFAIGRKKPFSAKDKRSALQDFIEKQRSRQEQNQTPFSAMNKTTLQNILTRNMDEKQRAEFLADERKKKAIDFIHLFGHNVEAEVKDLAKMDLKNRLATAKEMGAFIKNMLAGMRDDDIRRKDLEDLAGSIFISANPTAKNLITWARKIYDHAMDMHRRSLRKEIYRTLKTKAYKKSYYASELLNVLKNAGVNGGHAAEVFKNVGSNTLSSQQLAELYYEDGDTRSGSLVTAEEYCETLLSEVTQAIQDGRDGEKITVTDTDGNEYTMLAREAQIQRIEAALTAIRLAQLLCLARYHEEKAKELNGISAQIKDKELKNGYVDEASKHTEESISFYSQFIQAINAALAENKDAYKELLKDKTMRKIAICRAVLKDIGDLRPNSDSTLKQRKSGSALRALLSPSITLDTVCRIIGRNAIRGEGRTWSLLHSTWLAARENELRRKREIGQMIDEEIKSIFGNDANINKLLREQSDLTLDKEYSYYFGNGKITTKLSVGQALCLRAWARQKNGIKKIAATFFGSLNGLTAEDKAELIEKAEQLMEEINDELESKFNKHVQFADWVVDTLLPTLRVDYADRYFRKYNHEMAYVENYFPFKSSREGLYNSNLTVEEESFDRPKTHIELGEDIERINSANGFALADASFIATLNQHLAHEERALNYFEFEGIANAILGSKLIENKLNAIRPDLAERMREQVSVVLFGAATAKVRNSVDDFASKILQNIARSKIGFRVWTALKQFASVSMYITENPRVFAKAINPLSIPAAWKWANSEDGLRVLQERFGSRASGNEVLQLDSRYKGRLSSFIDNASKISMTPNAFVDMLVCANGAYAQYQVRLKYYTSAGFDEATAKTLARQDAEVIFNKSQQSQESFYMSKWQTTGGTMAMLTNMFMNSNYSWGRIAQQWWRDAKRFFGKDSELFKKEFKQTIADIYMANGLDEQQALDASEEEYKRKIWTVLCVPVGLAISTVAWNLLSETIPTAIAAASDGDGGDGDDDDEGNVAIFFSQGEADRLKNSAQRAMVTSALSMAMYNVAGQNLILPVLEYLVNAQLGLEDVSNGDLMDNVIDEQINEYATIMGEGFKNKDMVEIIANSLFFVSTVSTGVDPRNLTEFVASMVYLAQLGDGPMSDVKYALSMAINAPQSMQREYLLSYINEPSGDDIITQLAMLQAHVQRRRTSATHTPSQYDVDLFATHAVQNILGNKIDSDGYPEAVEHIDSGDKLTDVVHAEKYGQQKSVYKSVATKLIRTDDLVERLNSDDKLQDRILGHKSKNLKEYILDIANLKGKLVWRLPKYRELFEPSVQTYEEWTKDMNEIYNNIDDDR